MEISNYFDNNNLKIYNFQVCFFKKPTIIMWEIIKNVLDNNRRELTLTGNDIDERLDEIANNASGLFSLTELNLLRICKSSLAVIPEDLDKLVNLMNLVCQSNKLDIFPKSVGLLTKLTLLDLSDNNLTELPSEIDNLQNLASLIVSYNKLKQIPSLNKCKSLALLNASNNEIEDFLDISGGLELLADLNLSNNKIENIPANVESLSSLKKLEIENNSITAVPGNLSNCLKLKGIILIIISHILDLKSLVV